VFYVGNSEIVVQTAWPQDRALFALGPNAPNVSVLCDLWTVDYEVTGERTLRLTSVDMPFLSTHLGQYGLPVGTVFRPGQQFQAPEYVVTVAAADGGRPTVLELEFREPLNSPRYFFYHLSSGPPWRYRPVPRERVRFTIKGPSRLSGPAPCTTTSTSEGRPSG